MHFNSQPHKEADPFYVVYRTASDISTHSLTRRLTRFLNDAVRLNAFQLTASQGG